MKRLLGCAAVLVAFVAVVPARAQFPASPPAGTSVEVDPIRCWWRTSSGAVRVGEIFDLSLTCAVLDSDAVQVLPDESRLGAESIQFSPFEVVSGTHPADLRSGARRFFQYQYQLRIISPDAVDRDIALPAMAIHYTINNRVASNAAVQGRDLAYILPSFLMRVSSMVPINASDIRDAAGADFDTVDQFRFRASVLDIVATTCLVLGVLVVVVIAIGLLRRGPQRTSSGDRRLATRQLASAAVGELRAVGRERDANGWSGALAGRALAATRLAASCAIGAHPSQRLAGPDATPGEGRILLTRGFRRKARIVAGAATPSDVARAISTARPADAARTPMLDSLREALTAFGRTQYQRAPALDQGALDAALTAAQSAAAQVRREHSWWRTLWQQRRASNAMAIPSQA